VNARGVTRFAADNPAPSSRENAVESMPTESMRKRRSS
jgi:hypothetical protein